jgi:signal transduction histidine kinase
MSDIIWAINPMQDSMDKILKRMNYYAAPLTLARNMQFDFEAEEEIQQLHLSMEKRKNLYLIFKESIINALKYSEGASICVRLYRNEGFLYMVVKDDGNGISQYSEQGNGLNNMKLRAEDIGGQLEINSLKNEGTAVNLKIPL